jgi:pyruvate dehydrogenase E1 component alpha subunit
VTAASIHVQRLRRMLRARRFEEMVIRLAQAHAYIGRQHLHIGHEATGAAVAEVMWPADRIHTTHRNHGYLIACGADPAKAMAEIMGRADGLNGGKGGSWHLVDTAAGFQSTSAMVGGSVSLAIGAAFALKQQSPDAISIAHFGDGTLDEGICYESFNAASVFELPVLFVCENNSKAGQRPSSMLAASRLGAVPEALRIKTMIVDGADAVAAAETFAAAAAEVRKTRKPVFVEATLERWPGSHQVMPSFPTGVTTLEHAWNEKAIEGRHADWIGRFDPILRYARNLAAYGVASREEITALDDEAIKEMEAARAFAESSPYPPATAALEGAFA